MGTAEEVNVAAHGAQMGGRSIRQINVRSLFGYLDYSLVSRGGREHGDAVILYGENGSGKTTLLHLLFHLLSPARNRGHRNAIAKTSFKSFQVVLSDGTSVGAVRGGDRLTGAYGLIIERKGERIADCLFDPDREPEFQPPGAETDFLGYLQDLDQAMYFLSADRHIKSDLWQQKADSVGPDDHMLYSLTSKIRFNRELKPRSGGSLEFALRRAVDWIRGQAVKGTDVGSRNTNSIYADIIRRIAASQAPDAEHSTHLSDLCEKLRRLGARTTQFSKFRLTPPFPADELVSIVSEIGIDRAGIAESVLEPFINSTNARLDALEDLRRVTSIFIDALNSFYRTKRVTFGLGDGLKIQSPTGQLLQPSWLSSGEQQLLLLFCHTLAARKEQSIFIIDEPELSLNVKWQRRLIDALIEIVADREVQFVFATHSVEVLAQHMDKVIELVPAEKNGGGIDWSGGE